MQRLVLIHLLLPLIPLLGHCQNRLLVFFLLIYQFVDLLLLLHQFGTNYVMQCVLLLQSSLCFLFHLFDAFFDALDGLTIQLPPMYLLDLLLEQWRAAVKSRCWRGTVGRWYDWCCWRVDEVGE